MLVGLLLCPVGVLAQDRAPGVTDNAIKLGHSGAFSGPASAYSNFSRVYGAYLKAVNESGGVNGRKIELIQLDNGYNPSKALEASRQLVESDGVLAEVGTLGTAPNAATQRYLNSKKVPQLFIAAGGRRFNEPKQYPWTVPFYVSFPIEAAILAKYVLKAYPDAKIAVLYQNDDYGKDYLNGLKSTLGDRKSMVVAEASYELTDPTVDSQIINLAALGATVFLAFSTPKATAQAIRKAADLKWSAVKIVSGGASSRFTMEQAGIENSIGVISAHSYKDPDDPTWANDPGMLDYLAFMKKYAPNEVPADNAIPYVNAQTLEYVLKQAGKDLTRERLIKAATNITRLNNPMLLPGIALSNSPNNHNLFHELQISRFDGKRWIKLDLIKED
jgi:ABC-type branched-subunit amino acid transport system substrate-binding protein